MLFVVDAKAGITPGDEEIAQILRESRKPTLVLANKIDDPAQDSLAYDLHRLGLGDPIPVSGLHGYGTGDLLDDVLELPPRHRQAAGRRGGDPGRHPRPAECRQVVAAERVPRRRARDRLGGTRHNARHDRHGAEAWGDDVRARRHGRHASQTKAAAGHRVLLGAARDRRRRACRRRARPRRRVGGGRRPGSRGRRCRTQGDVLDDRRPREVGRRHRWDRGCSPAARSSAAAAAAADRGLGQDRPRHRSAARPDRAPVRQAQRTDLHRRAQPLPRRVARGPAAAAARRPAGSISFTARRRAAGRRASASS